MTSASEWRVSAVVLAGVLALGVGLAVSLPRQENRPVLLHIGCVSGAPVVGAWVEASNGGSGFANPTGVLADGRAGFAFELGFGGAYEVHAGCGGSFQRWKKVLHSTSADDPNRTLLCDDTVDVATTSHPGSCRDLR